jgi:methionyl-tRNA formyltransferase
MVSKMDAGPMLVQKKVSVLDSDNAGDVLEKLLSLCENMVPDVLDHFDDYYANRQSQNENEVTYASKIQAQDLVIDWNRSAQEIHNQIRALSPSPCAYCLMNQEGQVKRLKILNSKVLLNSSLKPGQIQVKENTFQVGCQEGVLSLQVVQLEGKKIMPIKDFVLGLASSKEFSILR